MLEATLTGGVHALQNNNMVSLAGGNKEIFNEWKELIQDAIGEVVVLCGDIGAGAIAKVVSNMLAFTNMVAASECMMIAKKAGLDLENFLMPSEFLLVIHLHGKLLCHIFLIKNMKRGSQWT
ncbi:MAG: hypothetical protein CM15mP70_00670 [Pelagibacteraceae bacterium]|nr:MAG: hypothetical protein CM15mP70_00670 [Pelagibacteraceae bacterium]